MDSNEIILEIKKIETIILSYKKTLAGLNDLDPNYFQNLEQTIMNLQGHILKEEANISKLSKELEAIEGNSMSPKTCFLVEYYKGSFESSASWVVGIWDTIEQAELQKKNILAHVEQLCLNAPPMPIDDDEDWDEKENANIKYWMEHMDEDEFQEVRIREVQMNTVLPRVWRFEV